MHKNFLDFEDFKPSDAKKAQNKSHYLKSYLSENLLSLTLFVASVCVLLLTLAIAPRVVSYDVEEVDSSPAVIDTQDKSVSEELRVFRIYGEKIGVFFKDGELDFIIDVKASSLPDYDRELLTKGIIAYGSEEIHLLTEGLTEMN